MTTPTPEQLQEFKDFYVELYTKKDGAEKAKQLLRYADEWWIMAYNNNAAYAHHKLMKQETYLIEKLEEAMASYDFPKREKDLLYFATQGLRKVAALQELVESSMKEVHKHTRLTLEFKDKVVELQQQLTEANAEIERLTSEGIKEWDCPTCGKCESFQVVQRHIKCKKCEQQFTTDLQQMMKPERFAHYDVAKELAQTATERKLFYEYERLEAYIEQQEKYRLEAYQRIDDLNAEIERLKGMIGVKHIPPITGSGVKYENGQSEIVSTLCNKCQKPYCICKR